MNSKQTFISILTTVITRVLKSMFPILRQPRRRTRRHTPRQSLTINLFDPSAPGGKGRGAGQDDKTAKR